ncbi:Ankyrin repeat and sterile alpha motif domain-containing protein 1B [Mactra antiquata]
MGKELELLEAARTGNYAAVEKLLTNKARKSHVGGLGQKLTSFLKSVNVNYTDRNGYTALHHAAVNGHRDIVELLLKSDAQPGIVDSQGCTPVHLAAWNGDAEVVMQLLTAGHDSENVDPVSINQQNSTGDTALHCAAQHGHVAVVDVLLNKSAAPTIRNLNDASPLDLAAQYGRLEVVQRLLISHPELAHHPSSTQSPLHLASRNGHRDIAAVLLDNHFDIQTVTEEGSALHEAALHGKLDVVKLLLERGINVNIQDEKQQTVLELISAHKSQQKSFTEIIQAIENYSRGSEIDSGLYDSLANCHSGATDKPTAAVRPLPPEKPSPPNKPHPPGDIALEPSKSPNLSGDKRERPIPSPRRSIRELTPDDDEEKPVAPLYTKPNKDKLDVERVESCASIIKEDAPPPLPPRSSIFATPDEKSSVLSHQQQQQQQQEQPITTSVQEKSPKTVMAVPRKPPRQKKSPMSVRRSPAPGQTTEVTPPSTVISQPNACKAPPTTDTAPPTKDIVPPITDIIPPAPPQKAKTENIPYQNMDIPSNQSDNLKIESNQTAKQTVDQSHSSLSATDQSNSSKTHSTSPGPPVANKPKLSPKPLLPRRPTIPKPKEDDSVDPVTGKQVKQPFYMEMTGNQTKQTKAGRPVSEVKPQVKTTANEDKPKDDLKPTAPKEDNYGMLFQNLKKDPKKNLRPDLKRTNTAPEETEYVKPHPASPTDKFKDKHGHLKRTNTAPEETYVPMNNPKKDKEQKDKEEPNENEYSEIPEKSVASSAPVENIYATIAETKQDNVPQTSEGTKTQEISVVVPDTLVQDKEASEPKVSPKPNYLEFMKNKPNTPLTPTGYPQPPTPDFPPPSPATAMMGIELKISQIDTKRQSRDITTLTDDTLESIEEHKSEVKVTAQTAKVKDIDEGSSSTETVSEKVNEKLKIEGDSVSVKSDLDQEVGAKKVDKEEDTVEESVYEVLYECKSVIKPNIKDIPKSSIPLTPVIEAGPSDSVEPTRSEQEPSSTDKVKVMEGATSDTGNTVDVEGSPVVMRKKSSVSNPDMDVFKGLLRGSTVGVPTKVRSQFYNEVIRQSRIRNPDSGPLKSTMEKEEEIDVDQVMKSIDVEVAKRASTSDSANFDDTEEWAKIADIMSSFGGNLTTFTSPTYSPSEEEFNIAFEAYMDNLLSKRERGSGQMISVGEWLESVGLTQYENAFVANGYDNIDFLDHKILEEGDLEQIGVLSHDHRQKILQATRSLPQLQPIDPNNPPPSVEEWLMSLQLLEYLETFRSHGYDTMEKVQSILWELQLRTVLDISMLGHRKRILTSLGERKPSGSQKKRSISSLSPEESRSPFNNIDLFKDYTQVKPVSSSEEDIKESSQMVVDSSEDEDVFKKQAGQSIRNSNIHLRPPHLAQTSSPAKQWRHKPEMLIKGCCNYTAQYLGSTVVPELTGGTDSTRAGITKLKHRFLRQLQKSADILAKIPIIMLSISYKGVKFIDAKSKKVICDHEIGNIFCACQDTDNLNFFAYITRDIQTGQHYCHVFSVKSSSLAHDIILTLGESFEVAYQMALKEKSMEEAMELDRKMSQSDPEDTYSTKSGLSTNTV